MCRLLLIATLLLNGCTAVCPPDTPGDTFCVDFDIPIV